MGEAMKHEEGKTFRRRYEKRTGLYEIENKSKKPILVILRNGKPIVDRVGVVWEC
jgi:hypothetical protein